MTDSTKVKNGPSGGYPVDVTWLPKIKQTRISCTGCGESVTLPIRTGYVVGRTAAKFADGHQCSGLW